MDIITEIKNKQGIVAVAEHLIPNLRKNSSRLVGTIRGEKTPALTVYPESQSWFHFAGDETPKGRQGGDVIDLIEYVKNCDTGEAIKFLANFFNIPYQPLTEEDKKRVDEQRLVQNILLFAATFYHDKLFKPEAEKYRQYLYNRGLSEDRLKKNLIGVAGKDKELLEYLRKAGFSLEEIKRSSLITENSHDFFQYRIIFPLFKNGSVVYMTGRKTEDTPENEWEQAKYKHLPTNEWVKNDYLFNEDALKNGNEVILCEGIPDCLTLAQWEFNAVALLGNSLKEELAKKLEPLKIIYIAVDADGKSNPLKIAEVLGNRARIVALPKGEEDINELAIKGKLAKESFQELLNNSKNLVEYQLPASLKEYQVDLSEFNNVVIKRGGFQYQVSQIEERNNGLKATIALLENEKTLNRDRILLVSGKSRKTFAKDCSENKGKIKEIQQHLLDIEQILGLISKPKKEESPEKKEITKEEIEEALIILKSLTLIYDIKTLFQKLLIAGEERNCLLVYLSGTSRILDSPISLIGKGDSAVGKSYLTGKIFKLFPEESYIDITYATGKSFYHADRNAFKHKIILFVEKPGAEQSDYSIRVLQSEKKLKIQIPIKDPQTGELKTEIKEVEGPVAFVTTTTSAQIYSENETRCFSFYCDEGEKQTFDTFEMSDAKYRGIEEISEKELRKFKNIQRVLRPYPVYIPYVEEIRKKFPKRPVRVRRDYGRLLALIEVATLLHQHQRGKKEINGKEYLVSTLADYWIAKTIGEDILRETIFELPPKSKELLQEAKKLQKEKEVNSDEEDSTFSIRELSRKIGGDYDTCHKWFEPAYERGYFEMVDEQRGRIGARYTLSNKKVESVAILPSLEELAKKYPEYLGEIYDPLSGEKVELKLNCSDVPIESENT